MDLNQRHIPKKPKEENPQPASPDKKLEKKNSFKNTNFKELHRGLAHSGIFIAGIEMFRKLAPKLEKIFEKLNDPDYNLIVTGHSLGGGMTLMMVLLLLIHPLKYFKVNFFRKFFCLKLFKDVDVRRKIRGYTFGAPPVFSKELKPLFEGVIFNVINEYDLVPRLSFGTIKDVIRIILTFDEIHVDILKIFYMKPFLLEK